MSIKTANGDYKVKAEHIFINTGTAPNMPAIKGIEGNGIYNSTTFMELKEIPKQVAIVGGEFIGLEFAGMLAKRKSFATAVFLTPPYARIGKDGQLKTLVNESNGKIIGCMLYCAESHELINIVKLAMDQGITYDKLRDQIYTHPTMTEAFNEFFQDS